VYIFFGNKSMTGMVVTPFKLGQLKKLPKNIAIGNWNGIAPELVFKNILFIGKNMRNIGLTYFQWVWS